MIKCSSCERQHALLAQLDRVFGYEPKGQGFESLAARQETAVHLQVRGRFAFSRKRDSKPERVSGAGKQSGGLFFSREGRGGYCCAAAVAEVGGFAQQRRIPCSAPQQKSCHVSGRIFVVYSSFLSFHFSFFSSMTGFSKRILKSEGLQTGCARTLFAEEAARSEAGTAVQQRSPISLQRLLQSGTESQERQ